MKRSVTLRLIPGNQLNAQHSWFEKVRKDTIYTLMEVRQETDSVKHPIQCFSAPCAISARPSHARDTVWCTFAWMTHTMNDPLSAIWPD